MIVNILRSFNQKSIIRVKISFIKKQYFFSTSKSVQARLRLPQFSHFTLQQSILKYLQSSNIHTPTYIQYALLSSLKDNYNKIHHITSPTGSGKTLAYLLPIINHLKTQQIQQGAPLTQAMRPRALVVTLNKELAFQTRNVGKSISHFCKIKCDGLNLGKSLNQQKKMLENGVDLLVTTHKRLKDFVNRKQVYLTNLDWIVIDQADTFYEVGKLDHLLNDFQYLYQASQQRPRYSRLLLSGTTNPLALKKYISQRFKTNFISLFDNKSHVNLENIKHQFIQAFDKDKHQLLLSLIFRQKNIKTLIFCNSVKSVQELQYYLEEQGVKVVTLHSQLNKNVRRVNYIRFRDSEENIMISSDLGARGLDFPNLERVINYDFPQSTADYLQRAGRTGRAGKKGLVITIYRKHDIDVINELKGSSFDKPIKISNSAYALKNRQDSHKSKYQQKSVQK